MAEEQQQKPLDLEYVPLERLEEWPRNPKSHALDELRRSMERFGYTAPILVDDETGRIVAGHGRVDALRQLQEEGEGPPDRVRSEDGGWLVPVVRGVRFDSEAEAEAYLLADNRLTEVGGWDDSELAATLADLSESENGALEGLGWEDDEVDSLVAAWEDDQLGEVEEDEGPTAVPDDPESERGEVYELGRHRLLCGDSTSEDDVRRALDGEEAALVFTDPPYGVSYEDTGPGAWDDEKLAKKEAGELEPRFDPIEGDELRGEDLYEFLTDAFAAWRPNVREDAAWYVWHASRTQILFERALEEAGYTVRAQVMWAKTRPAFNFGQYKYQHEPCFYAHREDTPPAWYGDRTQTTLWEIGSESGADYLHPTQKPVGLAEIAIRNSSRVDEVVIDPFAGSGSTLIAAEQLDRRCVLLEIDPGYCDVVRQRYADFTGQEEYAP